MQATFSLPNSFPKRYRDQCASYQTEDAFFKFVSEDSISLRTFLKKCEKYPPEKEWYKKNASLISRIIFKAHENFTNLAKEVIVRPEGLKHVNLEFELVTRSHSLSLQILSFQKPLL